MKISKLFGIGLLTISVSLTSCSDGEDGAPGLSCISCWDTNADGINDADEDINQDGEFNALDCQGLYGQDGEDGMDGTDGEGFDEMSQFGSISLNLSGTRPDGEAFEDSAVFKFAGLDGDFPEGGGNTMIIQEGQDFTTYPFRIFRFLVALPLLGHR